MPRVIGHVPALFDLHARLRRGETGLCMQTKWYSTYERRILPFAAPSSLHCTRHSLLRSLPRSFTRPHSAPSIETAPPSNDPNRDHVLHHAPAPALRRAVRSLVARARAGRLCHRGLHRHRQDGRVLDRDCLRDRHRRAANRQAGRVRHSVVSPSPARPPDCAHG